MYAEDDLIPISALQHVLFCDRQYALIHLEQVWEDNCSLVDMCMPKSAGTKNKQVNRFIQTQLRLVRKTCETEGDIEVGGGS